MKKRLLKLTWLTLASTLLAIVIAGCNKSNQRISSDDQADHSDLIERSKKVHEHVLDFKSRMEYYRDNPGVKSGGQLYEALEGAEELEALINYNFCHSGIECDSRTLETTEIIMPLDDLEKINDPKLSEVYYNKLIDTVQEQMGRVSFNNKKLLVVDLKMTGTDSNGDAIISIKSLIGNEAPVPGPRSEDGWYYGYFGGTCEEGSTDPYEGIWDAANELQNLIHTSNALNPAPPPGYIKRYNIIYTEQIIDPNQAQYRTENDPLDNFLDYDIYYATSSLSGYPITDDTKCLSSLTEMPHYELSYSNVVTDVIADKSVEYGTSLSYINSLVIGERDYDQTFVKHIFIFQIGEVWLMQEYGFEVEDILAY